MYLYDSLTSSRNRCVLVAKLDNVLWKPFDHVRHEAYATIVTGDASTYVSGAVVNGIAISSKDSSRDMVALVTHMSRTFEKIVTLLWLESVGSGGFE